MSTNNGNPSPGYPVTPVLQLADGSYVGTAFDNGTSMVAFDTSGNIKWTLSGYGPQMATADGGIIASSGTTFDANGIATGQLPNLPQFQSWLGNGYNFGSIEYVALLLPNLAQTFAAFAGGNASGNGTATGQPQYAQLPSCQGAQTPCPKEAAYAALGALVSTLSKDCSLCQANVFDKVSMKQADFANYLQNAKFFDGTTSQAKRCGALYKCTLLGYLTDGWTVAHFFELSGSDETAATLTPSSPLQTFFRPAAISLSSGGVNVLNMATIFHEGLHGKTGKTDTDLQKALSCKQQDDTRNITWYLEQFVRASSPSQVQPCTQYPGTL